MTIPVYLHVRKIIFNYSNFLQFRTICNSGGASGSDNSGAASGAAGSANDID